MSRVSSMAMPIDSMNIWLKPWSIGLQSCCPKSSCSFWSSIWPRKSHSSGCVQIWAAELASWARTCVNLGSHIWRVLTYHPRCFRSPRRSNVAMTDFFVVIWWTCSKAIPNLTWWWQQTFSSTSATWHRCCAPATRGLRTVGLSWPSALRPRRGAAVPTSMSPLWPRPQTAQTRGE
ncbi:unnamed protein product [Durusdinium trenchii]|uniref:Uncharacterized protein n=1 Tax=Durusdinium trenchii TaxID=1381693 RepID=A0ABP0P7N9_9DINO